MGVLIMNDKERQRKAICEMVRQNKIKLKLVVDGGIKARKYGAALCQNLEHIADII